jgi:hypothetical protein
MDIYRIYNVYIGGSLHNNISKKTNADTVVPILFYFLEILLCRLPQIYILYSLHMTHNGMHSMKMDLYIHSPLCLQGAVLN